MAYKKIQFKRGTKTGMPVLRSGEPGFTQDEKSLYIGDGTANQRFLNEVQVGTKIDEKIAPVTQSITNNVAALNESIASNITTVNQAITDKAKINGEATNVNFIENKVVQDGLIFLHEKLQKNISETFNDEKIEMIVSGWLDATERTSSIFQIVSIRGFFVGVDSSGVWYCSGNGVPYTTIGLGYAKTGKCEIRVSMNGLKCIFSVETDTNKITKTFDFTSYSNNIIGFISGTNLSINKTYFNVYAYNRQLTQQELQHNFSVLNNAKSISKINDYAIATDTDHVQDRTGRVQDTINRVFYKQACKEFTSNGGGITVNNGMDGYVLQSTIQGQTVKNYAQNGSTPKTVVKNNSYVIGCKGLQQGGSYTLIAQISSLIGTATYNIYNQATTSAMQSISRTISSTGIYKVNLTCENPDSAYQMFFHSASSNDMSIIIDWAIMVDTINKDIINSYIPFGLSSTQATVYNNGLKYSFYANLEDKLANRVLDLGGLEGARNTWELKEDGSAVYTQGTEKVIIRGVDFASYLKYTSTSLLRYYNPALYKRVTDILICDIYRSAVIGNVDDASKIGYITKAIGIDYFDIILEKDKYTNIDDARSKHPDVTIVAKLATPIVTTIPKELVPTILTQATNTFTFGEGVMATKATISVPVDRISEMQTEINEIKALITTPSNINLTMNYVEDEYNKNQSVEGVV